MQEDYYNEFYISLKRSNDDKLDELVAIVRHKMYQYLGQLEETIGRSFAISESKLQDIFIDELSNSIIKNISKLFEKQTEIIEDEIRAYENSNNQNSMFLNSLEEVTTKPRVNSHSLELLGEEYVHFLRRKLERFEEINRNFDSYEVISMFKRILNIIIEEYDDIMKNHLKSSHNYLTELIQNVKTKTNTIIEEKVNETFNINEEEYPTPTYDAKMAKLKQMLSICNMELILDGEKAFAKDLKSGNMEEIIFYPDTADSFNYYKLQSWKSWEWLGIYIKSKNNISGPHFGLSHSNNKLPIKVNFDDSKNIIFIEGILDGEKHIITFKGLGTNNLKHKVYVGEFEVEKQISLSDTITLLNEIAPNAISELELNQHIKNIDYFITEDSKEQTGLPTDVFDQYLPGNVLTDDHLVNSTEVEDLQADIAYLEDKLAKISAELEKKKSLLKEKHGIDANVSFKVLKDMQNQIDEDARKGKLNKNLGDFFL